MSRSAGLGSLRSAAVARGVFIAVMVIFLAGVGSALASSGQENNGGKGWAATDTYRVMNFVVLAVGLYLVLKKPVSETLRGRITGIKEELEELEFKKQDAEKKLAQYNEQLSLLDKERERIIEAYIRQGKEARTRILKEAEASAEKLEANARRQIKDAFQRAKVEVREAILDEAFEKAEAAIRANISAEDQVRLVDDYLEKVVA